MSDTIHIPTFGPIHASIRPPGSKSITNRALVCATLADGRSTLSGVLDSEDTQVMVAGLRLLGFDIEQDREQTTICLTGGGGKIPAEAADINVANSGTTIRFLTALCCLGSGQYRLDGIDRMRQRPIGDLLAALTQLGANVHAAADNACPPVVVQANRLRGGTANIRGDISSQFLSALLMAAPYAEQDVKLVVDGPLVSKPYVQMTLGVMASFGVEVNAGDLTEFRVPGNMRYQACQYAIEPDASAASYFWAAAAVTGGTVTVEGLGRDALQGDVAFCDCLQRMGCEVIYENAQISVRGGNLRGIQVDMNSISDTVQTLAAVALFADGPTTITNVAHIRHKETDRIGDLARELRKLGAAVDELSDGLRITPGKLGPAEIDTYNDHRMAMSLALVGLRVPGVVIKDPGCTAKTYPRYFEDLQELAATKA